MDGFEQHQYVDTCRVCGWHGTFLRTARAIRETYACGACRATLRYRVQAEALVDFYREAGVATLTDLVPASQFVGLDVYEPGISGPFRPLLRRLPRYRQSFYWDDVAPGDVRDGVECQDLMRLTLSDASVDVVITSDMFEHVRRPLVAFREIHRILRPGGLHVFTIPTAVPMPDVTLARVDTEGPDDVLLLPAIYHGDGRGGRSLVYTDFGRDLIDELEAIGLLTYVFHGATSERIVKSACAFVSVKAV